MTVAIRGPRPGDRAAWDRLYAGYAAFYRKDQTAEMRDRVWGWIMDPGHEVCGLLAEGEGGVVGLAHFRPFARPLDASVGGWLDDLFVAPEARGLGAAQAMIWGVADVGRAKGWSMLRWLTAGDNAAARGVYDRIAPAAGWVTYDLGL